MTGDSAESPTTTEPTPDLDDVDHQTRRVDAKSYPIQPTLQPGIWRWL
ncbi:MAG: hypothetical protein ACRCYU_10325 [Nocardioides sp.]